MARDTLCDMPTALLIHGVGNGPSSMWRLEEWLHSAGWETTSFALLGHGGRPAAPSYALEAFADDVLTAGDFDLVVGHSLGASVAVVAAAKHPAFAKQRVLLIEPALVFTAEQRTAAKTGELVENALTRDQIAKQHPRWNARDLDAKAAEAARALPEAIGGVFDENPDWDLRPHVAKLAVPTLLLTGDPELPPSVQDHSVVPNDLVEGLLDATKHLRREVVRGVGHSPHRDDPGATQVALLDWLYTSD